MPFYDLVLTQKKKKRKKEIRELWWHQWKQKDRKQKMDGKCWHITVDKLQEVHDIFRLGGSFFFKKNSF